MPRKRSRFARAIRSPSLNFRKSLLAVFAPHMHKLAGFEAELAQPMRDFVGDPVHSNRVFEYDAVRPLEIQEPRPRGRVTPRPEDDRHPLLVQEIVGAHDVIAARQLMIDVLHAGLRRAHKRDRVVDRVDAHQRNVSYPVDPPLHCRPQSRRLRHAPDQLD